MENIAFKVKVRRSLGGGKHATVTVFAKNHSGDTYANTGSLTMEDDEADVFIQLLLLGHEYVEVEDNR